MVGWELTQRSDREPGENVELGLWVWDLRFRDSGFRVPGLGFRV